MSEQNEWYETGEGLWSNEDCSRFAVPVAWDGDRQVPQRDIARWAQLAMLAFQRCYDSALATQQVEGVECVVIDIPPPA